MTESKSGVLPLHYEAVRRRNSPRAREITRPTRNLATENFFCITFFRCRLHQQPQSGLRISARGCRRETQCNGGYPGKQPVTFHNAEGVASAPERPCVHGRVTPRSKHSIIRAPKGRRKRSHHRNRLQKFGAFPHPEPQGRTQGNRNPPPATPRPNRKFHAPYCR